MKTLSTVMAAACCFVPTAASAGWPHGARAAVVLTYDDALTSQLDHAVPVLERAGLKATFFLSNVKRADVARWRWVAQKGNELANHTVFHACPAAQYPADPRNTTEAYTPPSMLAEIEQENVLLTALDGRAEHGYGTPCGNNLAGGKDYLGPLRASGKVSYIRYGFAKPEDASVGAASMDPTRIPARDFPEGTTGQQLIDYARQARAGGGAAVYVFHGVAGEYLNVTDAAHRELIGWLVEHRRDVWVATMQEMVDWMNMERAKAATRTAASDSPRKR